VTVHALVLLQHLFYSSLTRHLSPLASPGSLTAPRVAPPAGDQAERVLSHLGGQRPLPSAVSGRLARARAVTASARLATTAPPSPLQRYQSTPRPGEERRHCLTEELWPWSLPLWLGMQYQHWSRSHYLEAAVLQAGLLRAGANLAAQHCMVLRGQQDQLRLSTVAAMGALGAGVSGLGGGAWSRMLEHRLGRSVGRGKPGDCVMKVLCDFAIFAPMANAIYLVVLALSRGGSLADALASLSFESFSRVMLLEATLFMPYSALAFNLIPWEFRPLSQSCVAAAFTIGLSTIG